MSTQQENPHMTEHRESSASSSRGSNRKERKAEKKAAKRKRDGSLGIAMGATLSVLRQPDLPEFNLTSAKPSSAPETEGQPTSQEVEDVRPCKKAKKIPKPQSENYPAIIFSLDCKLQAPIKIADFQNLVLYLFADGTAPQWTSVRHRNQFRKVVVLMIPGLERDMFIEQKKEESGSQEGSRRNSFSSANDHYPVRLSSQSLPEELQPFAEIFEHVWPVQTPGEERYSKMYSPIHAMLTTPAPRDNDEKKSKKIGSGPKPVKDQGCISDRTRITEFLCSAADLEENGYVLHPAMYDSEEERTNLLERRKKASKAQADGWVDTNVDNFKDGAISEPDIEQGSLTAGRIVLAMDCEMCMTAPEESSLTRISIVAWDGSVVLDELVKPAKPITDYVTMYSGITKEMLENVTTTLEDIQQKLVTLLTPQTILVGHSLESDLTALRITHPYIVDTALIYPHPRGPPLKQALKYIAQKFLNRAIQSGHGTTGPGAGHDSIEDARTCLDLVKQKCEKGKSWGANETGENLFKRLMRTGVKYKSQGGTAVVSAQTGGKTSAAIDWGDPKRGAGAAATVTIGCQNDDEVVAGIKRAVLGDADGKEVPGGGVDFVWARFRELESLKGWWNDNKLKLNESKKVNVDIPPDSENSPSNPDPAEVVQQELEPEKLISATAELSQRLKTIHSFLPPCTALVVYSGSGDPREMSRLQQMHQTHRTEFKIKKWDELSVKWTDVEQQALKRAFRTARRGVGFVSVK